MSRTQPPRDAITATDLWVPVDATGEDFYALGNRFGTQVGVLHALHKESGQPLRWRWAGWSVVGVLAHLAARRSGPDRHRDLPAWALTVAGPTPLA